MQRLNEKLKGLVDLKGTEYLKVKLQMENISLACVTDLRGGSRLEATLTS